MSLFSANPTEGELLDLADRVANGEAAATNRLVQLYADRIRAMATRRTCDPEAARELADDVMMAAICALRNGKVRDKQRLGAFIYGTAEILINNFLRSRARRPILSQLPDDLPDPDGSEILESGSDFDHIRRCFEGLNPQDRQVLQFLFVDGIRPKEIAERIGLTENVIRQRKRRALKHLKVFLDKSDKQGVPRSSREQVT